MGYFNGLLPIRGAWGSFYYYIPIYETMTLILKVDFTREHMSVTSRLLQFWFKHTSGSQVTGWEQTINCRCAAVPVPKFSIPLKLPELLPPPSLITFSSNRSFTLHACSVHSTFATNFAEKWSFAYIKHSVKFKLP